MQFLSLSSGCSKHYQLKQFELPKPKALTLENQTVCTGFLEIPAGGVKLRR